MCEGDVQLMPVKYGVEKWWININRPYYDKMFIISNHQQEFFLNLLGGEGGHLVSPPSIGNGFVSY